MTNIRQLTFNNVERAFKEVVTETRQAIKEKNPAMAQFSNNPYLNPDLVKNEDAMRLLSAPNAHAFDPILSGVNEKLGTTAVLSTPDVSSAGVNTATVPGYQTTELLPFLFQTLMAKLDINAIPFLRSVNWQQTMSNNVVATVREAFGGMAQPIGFDQTATPTTSPGIRNFEFSPGMWESRVRYNEEFLTAVRSPTYYDVRGALDYMDFGIAKVSFQILQRMINVITNTVCYGEYMYDGVGKRGNLVSMGFSDKTTINFNWGTYNTTTRELVLNPNADPAGDFIRVFSTTEFPLLQSMRSSIKAIHMNTQTSRAFTESARNFGNPLEAMGFSAVMTKDGDPFTAGNILMSNAPQMPKVPVVIDDSVYTMEIDEVTGAPTNVGATDYVIPTGYIILEYDNMAQMSLNYTARTDYMPAATDLSRAVGQYLRVVDSRTANTGMVTPALEVYGGWRGGAYMPLVNSHQVLKVFNTVS